MNAKPVPCQTQLQGATSTQKPHRTPSIAPLLAVWRPRSSRRAHKTTSSSPNQRGKGEKEGEPLTQQQELPAVPVELLQVDAELVDGGPVAVLVQQHGELLDLLGGELRP